MGNQPMKTFLFLQGPHGPYFAMLADALRVRGHRALRININGGDKVDWPGEATDYRGTFRNWPLFFDDFVVNLRAVIGVHALDANVFFLIGPHFVVDHHVQQYRNVVVF